MSDQLLFQSICNECNIYDQRICCLYSSQSRYRSVTDIHNTHTNTQRQAHTRTHYYSPNKNPINIENRNLTQYMVQAHKITIRIHFFLFRLSFLTHLSALCYCCCCVFHVSWLLLARSHASVIVSTIYRFRFFFVVSILFFPVSRRWSTASLGVHFLAQSTVLFCHSSGAYSRRFVQRV